MIVTTSYCSRSGQGTPMYSRRGKSTINQYLCFSRETTEEEEKEKKRALAEKLKKSDINKRKSLMNSLDD